MSWKRRSQSLSHRLSKTSLIFKKTSLGTSIDRSSTFSSVDGRNDTGSGAILMRVNGLARVVHAVATHLIGGDQFDCLADFEELGVAVIEVFLQEPLAQGLCQGWFEIVQGPVGDPAIPVQAAEERVAAAPQFAKTQRSNTTPDLPEGQVERPAAEVGNQHAKPLRFFVQPQRVSRCDRFIDELYFLEPAERFARIVHRALAPYHRRRPESSLPPS